jgi:hypothetical protein
MSHCPHYSTMGADSEAACGKDAACLWNKKKIKCYKNPKPQPAKAPEPTKKPEPKSTWIVEKISSWINPKDPESMSEEQLAKALVEMRCSGVNLNSQDPVDDLLAENNKDHLVDMYKKCKSQQGGGRRHSKRRHSKRRHH